MTPPRTIAETERANLRARTTLALHRLPTREFCNIIRSALLDRHRTDPEAVAVLVRDLDRALWASLSVEHPEEDLEHPEEDFGLETKGDAK